MAKYSPRNINLPKILFITGVDGVGKSTISQWLKKYAIKYDHKCQIVWSRFNNYLSIPLLATTRISKHNYYEIIDGYKFGFHNFENLSIYKHIYLLCQIIDVNIATYFKIVKKIVPSSFLICERGPWDTLVDVISDTGIIDILDNGLYKFFIYQVLNNSETILIKRDYQNIILCRPELVHDKKIKQRILLYEKLANLNRWRVVDNNGSLIETKKTIIQYISKERTS